MLVCSPLLIASALAAGPTPNSSLTLGAYDYDAGESSPVVLNGRLLMVESISFCYPGHMRIWKPDTYDGAKCPSYMRVRDMHTGTVIANLTSDLGANSCNHTFGAAVVKKDEQGNEQLYISATRCARFQAAQSYCESPARAGAVCPCWSGAGPLKDCAVDIFVSSDQTLQKWQTSAGAFFPGKKLPNTDMLSLPQGVSIPGLPSLHWLMVLEFDKNNLIGTSDPKGLAGWHVLNRTSPVWACPSIKYAASDGKFYIMGGGLGVFMTRSSDLQHWESASGRWSFGHLSYVWIPYKYEP